MEENPEFIFNTAGIYTINLIAFDSEACEYNAAIDIEVEDCTDCVDNPFLEIVNSGIYCLDSLINFSVNTDLVGIISCDWDFGDGNVSTNCTTDYIYSNPGTYTINLQVTDENDCVYTTSAEVIIVDCLDPCDDPDNFVQIDILSAELCRDSIINMTLGTNVELVNQQWNTSDGQSASLFSPAFIWKFISDKTSSLPPGYLKCKPLISNPFSMTLGTFL